MCFSVLIINVQSGDFSDSWSCSQTVRRHNAKYKQQSRSITCSHTQSAEDEYNVDTDYPQVFDYEILVVCFTYCRHVFFSFLHKFFFFFPAM